MKQLLLSSVLACACTATVLAQQIPLSVSVTEPIRNEYGQPLSRPGGELIQYLYVNGAVFPPDPVTGEPHTNNRVIATSRIGQGVSPGLGIDGVFSAKVTPRPSGEIIARVFNAPTLKDASFYADSQPFVVEGWGPAAMATFVPDFGATTNAIDPRDDDGDGLDNSWEKSLGSNRNLVDSDGDGIGDNAEFRAGTSLTDDADFLAVVELIPLAGGHAEAHWNAVPGKRYQLEFVEGGMLSDDATFTPIGGVVTAAEGSDKATRWIENGLSYEAGFFRVVLVED
jgi:hypothetical protein